MDVIGPEKYVEYSDLPNLKYTERVLKEVMRLFPIGPLVVRAHEEDIEMGNYYLQFRLNTSAPMLLLTPIHILSLFVS